MRSSASTVALVGSRAPGHRRDEVDQDLSFHLFRRLVTCDRFTQPLLTITSNRRCLDAWPARPATRRAVFALPAGARLESCLTARPDYSAIWCAQAVRLGHSIACAARRAVRALPPRASGKVLLSRCPPAYPPVRDRPRPAAACLLCLRRRRSLPASDGQQLVTNSPCSRRWCRPPQRRIRYPACFRGGMGSPARDSH